MSHSYAHEGDSGSIIVAIKEAAPAILCGLTGALSAFTVPLVGLLPVGELVLILVFPWVMFQLVSSRGWPTRMQQLSWYKLMLIFVGIMLLGYVVSDLYRGTSSENLVRGWARVGFLGIDLVAIAYLINGSWLRLRVFIFALYFANSLNGMISNPIDDRWWEFGVGPSVTALALFLCAGRAMIIQVSLALLLAVVAMSLGARSLGGICMLTAVLFMLNRARGVMRPIALIAAAGAVAALLFAANAAILSNLEKTNSNVERRSMIETAADAFLESPFIGQGSWFTATNMISKLEEHRAKLDPTFHGYTEDEARQISIHSQILVALAEGGILGGSFFIFYGALLLKTIRTLTRHSVPRRAFTLYFVINGLWNLCMSPFSGVARTEIVLAICACLLVILQRQGELPEDYRE
ncbi:MAG TPA: O-antigen ligase family protein [Opitutaceae bacterium]|jgi:hypothetical protein|nr:O-antigen ligase family protein [Opitutaceae bacterium]